MAHQVALWRVSESVVRLTRPLVKENVRLLNCVSKDMPPIKGDSVRLMQVRAARRCDSRAHPGAATLPC